jgi:hypothetical protein
VVVFCWEPNEECSLRLKSGHGGGVVTVAMALWRHNEEKVLRRVVEPKMGGTD